MPDVLAPKNFLSIIRGTSKTLQLAVLDAAGKPYNLTGAKVVMTVKDRIEDTKNVFQKTTDSGVQALITDARGGIAQIFLVPADTHDREIKQYVFDIWVVSATGSRFAVVPPSVFDLQPGVTILP